MRLPPWLVCLLALLACDHRDAADARAGTVITIGYQKSGAPFLLKARAASLEARLAKQGARVRWLEFTAGPQLLEAMRGDGVDIGHTGEAPPIFAQAGGVPLVYAGQDPPSPEAEAILVPKNSTIRSVAALKGKRLALNRGSNVHYLVLRTLSAAGLSLTDVELVFLAPPDARSAFDSGTVDAWAIWDPFQAAAEIAGARVLATGQGVVDNRYFYLARRAFAEQHAELLATVMAEFEALSGWASSHPEDVAQQLAAASGISVVALLRAERRHHYGVSAIDEAVLAQQQAIADAFAAISVIPRAIVTREAQPKPRAAALAAGTP